ncbi:hypothetical protein [Spiroplasma endosymbiont of Glossina fuscipes fuscipes]|uniref:hypothetical protein n=1 Tax=Spiroplasma endosymbiont of Glossina fuscipes fuscipes TaxID=2004463 RepID=UPI003C76A973
MKYIIVPVSNKLAQEHYRLTVEKTLTINEIERLGELKLSDFLDKNGEYSVWGSKIQVNGQQKNIEKVTKNDQLIFYKNNKLFSLFNIVSIFKSLTLAQKLWGIDKIDNRMWENIFLLDKIVELDIDVK